MRPLRKQEDDLFLSIGVRNLTVIAYGATFTMHKADYAGGKDTGYYWSEFRMGFAFYSAQDLTLKGLTVRATGGDGILLQDANRNVHIKDCVFDNNCKQSAFNNFISRDLCASLRGCFAQTDRACPSPARWSTA